MNFKFIALIACLLTAVAVTGCYKKVSGGKRMGVPVANWAKDRVYGIYERPVDYVYNAALTTLRARGEVISESSNFSNPTNVVRTIVSRVDGRNVWVRVQPHDGTLTIIEVQARTPAGIADLPLAHTLEKEIAIQMVPR